MRSSPRSCAPATPSTCAPTPRSATVSRPAPAPDRSFRTQTMTMKQTPAHEVVNAELLGLVPPSARRIVGVGCMHGALARVVREPQPSVEYVGIDIDPDYAEVAAAHCTEAFSCDIEKIEPARWVKIGRASCRER